MENRDETVLKTFNTAKQYAEKIIFPLMDYYKKYERQANFGSYELEDSIELDEELRDIQRYNGLKAMTETCHDLLNAIKSVVKMKNNRSEIEMMNRLLNYTHKLKKLYYEKRDNFFAYAYKNGRSVEVLNREYFDKIKEIIDACYVNVEILMTKNKILFADATEDYMSDEELRDAIRKEYIEN